MLKRSLFRLFSAFLLVILWASPAVFCAETAKQAMENKEPVQPDTRYYYDAKHGWYWYKKEPSAEIEQDSELEVQVIHIPDYTYDQLWNMYPDRFQELLKKSMKIAVQQPSEKNVLRYLIYQDIARRKSTAFAGVIQYVGQKHPELSNADVYPITTPGRVALADMKSGEIDQKIREVSEQFALIVFSQAGCTFCEAQDSILQYFIRSYNWTVRTIDIDERPAFSARFGIEQTPTIILIKKRSKDFLPVATGVISLSELKTKVYRSIRIMLNETKPEQWFMYEFEKNRGSDPVKYVTKQGGVPYEIKD